MRTLTPREKLSVNGKSLRMKPKLKKQIRRNMYSTQDYKILALQGLDIYIKVNKHLPEMPSVSSVEKDGIELGKMNKLLREKCGI